MTKINAAALCAGLLTTAVVYLMSNFPLVPVWAMFIAWACFFHLGGGEQPGQAYAVTITHMGFGALAAWASALMVLASPWQQGVLGALWAPVLIGLVIAVILRMSAFARFSVTPAIIYGYAAIWAFLSTTGHFHLQALTAFSMQNALFAICLCILLGVTAGYLNARMVSVITKHT